MNITNNIKIISEKLNIYPNDIDLSYEDYLKYELGETKNQGSEPYYAEDIISLIGWNTSKSRVQELVYTTFSGNLQHGTKIHFEPGMQTKLHTHNYIEFAYVVRGKLVQNILGKREIFYENELCLIDSESSHTDILLAEESTVLFLGLESNFFDQFLHMKKSTQFIENYIIKLIAHKKDKYEFIRFYPKENAIKIKKTFEILIEEMFETNPCKSEIVKFYIERFLHLIPVEYRFVLTRKEQNELSTMLLQDIKNYIGNNHRSVSVQLLADIFKYNPDYLSKLCYIRTGMTLSKMIIDSRMKKAYSLLKTTDFSVVEIARQVGYNNVGFFYKKFKEKFASSPNNIRKS